MHAPRIVNRCVIAGAALGLAGVALPDRAPTRPLAAFADLIAASCPDDVGLDGPGVLCEGFERDRNAAAGIQWSRLPLGAHPTDPLRALGDPNDDILGFTIHGGPTPQGTDAATCRYDVVYPDCQDAVSEENDWHLHSPFEGPGDGYSTTPGIGAPDGGKARRGARSMHMGRHTRATNTLGDALRFRQVSAFVLDSQGDPNVPGLVPGPGSTLEFWHMISIPDDENFGSGFVQPGESFGGGQVQISLQGSDGTFDRWLRLDPVFNGYDSTVEGDVSLCSFDPTDDRVSPVDESFCGDSGGPVWADIGDIFGADPNCVVDTDLNDSLHKDCGDLSDCSGGPGCAETGDLGTGVWARSAFDLSPFAGRVARLRWIGMMEGGWSFGESRSAVEGEIPLPYELFEVDDGWYIDDLHLTDLRQSPLPCDGDLDGDGVANCHDCDTTDPSIWQGPGEATDLRFAPEGQSMTWSAPAITGTTVPRYDVIRSVTGGRFFDHPLVPVVCVASDGAATDASDPALPAVGGIFHYLVRAENGCPSVGAGPLGASSSGVSRTARPCP